MQIQSTQIKHFKGWASHETATDYMQICLQLSHKLTADFVLSILLTF
uniref:Uncharacterized protein n=1 Tax=Arundo donax TaxID=35708 RepID=A0A0A9BQT1_ARUDO